MSSQTWPWNEDVDDVDVDVDVDVGDVDDDWLLEHLWNITIKETI